MVRLKQKQVEALAADKAFTDAINAAFDRYWDEEFPRVIQNLAEDLWLRDNGFIRLKMPDMRLAKRPCFALCLASKADTSKP